MIDIYQDVKPEDAIFVGPGGYCHIKQVNIWEKFGRVCFTFKDARNEKDYPFINPAVSISLEEFRSLVNKVQSVLDNC